MYLLAARQLCVKRCGHLLRHFRSSHAGPAVRLQRDPFRPHLATSRPGLVAASVATIVRPKWQMSRNGFSQHSRGPASSHLIQTVRQLI
jgi:hypothetical protein